VVDPFLWALDQSSTKHCSVGRTIKMAGSEV